MEMEKFGLEERPLPEIVEDTDALVEVTLTTICSSDIHIKHGVVPRAKEGVILGHEFVGRVVRTGSAVKKTKIGRQGGSKCRDILWRMLFL